MSPTACTRRCCARSGCATSSSSARRERIRCCAPCGRCAASAGRGSTRSDVREVRRLERELVAEFEAVVDELSVDLDAGDSPDRPRDRPAAGCDPGLRGDQAAQRRALPRAARRAAPPSRSRARPDGRSGLTEHRPFGLDLGRLFVLDVKGSFARGPKTAHTIDDLRLQAKRRLPRMIYEFIEGGAEDEVTVRRNREACSRGRARARVSARRRRPGHYDHGARHAGRLAGRPRADRAAAARPPGGRARGGARRRRDGFDLRRRDRVELHDRGDRRGRHRPVVVPALPVELTRGPRDARATRQGGRLRGAVPDDRRAGAGAPGARPAQRHADATPRSACATRSTRRAGRAGCYGIAQRERAHLRQSPRRARRRERTACR